MIKIRSTLLRVYIGYDEREHEEALVARKTLLETSGIEPEFLELTALYSRGLLTRPIDRRAGTRYDLVSNKPASTDFAVSRFLVPILCQSGFALFTDCDVVFMQDVKELFALADPSFAVQVVKHEYTPSSTTKMDGQLQMPYKRKGWSSVVLYNCDHPANQRLTLYDINNRSGLYLHQFGWLHDSEIGGLPGRWNWMVGEQPKPASPAIAHFTLGTPLMPGYEDAEHAEIWLNARPGVIRFP